MVWNKFLSKILILAQLKKARLLAETLSFRKGWNYFRVVSSFLYSRMVGKIVHRGMPVKIGIEPTTSCNLRCPECLSGIRGFSRATGMLKFEDFKNITDQVYKDLIYMLLYFQGEPYLNKEFLEMAAYAKKKNIYTATSTNGHYLDKESAKKTVESGISEVIISVDGTEAETYAMYRIGGDFNKVLEGIKNLVEAREKLKSRTPYIVMQFLVMGTNEHEIERAKQLGKKLGVDKVSLKSAQILDMEKESKFVPKNKEHSRYKINPDGTYSVQHVLDDECFRLWQGAEITWDGKVIPCCFDKDATHVMGRVSNGNFKEIWKGEKYAAFRNSLLEGRDQIEMCKNCTEGAKIQLS